MKNLFYVSIYILFLTACNENNNIDKVIPTVKVENTIDTIKPVIDIHGLNPINIVQGTVYTDEGATAQDDEDGIVTVISEGSVDTKTLGIYTITYSAVDVSGNSATKHRTINIVNSSWETEHFTIGNHEVTIDNAYERIFLTLDETFDIPRDYTVPITWDSTCTFSINDIPISNASNYTFDAITYGSEATITRVCNGTEEEPYTILFTNLPVLHISTSSPIVDEPKTNGTFKLSSSSKDIPLMRVGIEIRGASAQRLVKKSYALELRKDDICQSGDSEKLLDLRKDDDWILDAAYRDVTFARNMMGHDTLNTMRSYAHKVGNIEKGQASIRGKLVELVLNKKYNGVYILVEKVDRKLLGLKKIDVKKDGCEKKWNEVDWNDPKNGSVIYKGINHSADFKHLNNHGFEQKYPKASEYDREIPLLKLIDFVMHSSNSDFIQNIDKKIDMDNFVDYFLAMMISNAGDAINKNQYIARSEEGRFFFVPWDWDQSFGMSWTGAKDNSWTRWPIRQNKLLDRLYYNPETGFTQKLKNRWDELRGTVLSNQAIKDRFNTYLSRQNKGKASKRTFQRWANSGYLGFIHRDELRSQEYLETWIDNRMSFIANKIKNMPMNIRKVVP